MNNNKTADFPDGSKTTKFVFASEIDDIDEKENSDFIESVNNYSYKDVSPKCARRASSKRKLGASGVLSLFIICSCIGVFTWSTLKIILSLTNMKTSQNGYDNLVSQFELSANESAIPNVDMSEFIYDPLGGDDVGQSGSAVSGADGAQGADGERTSSAIMTPEETIAYYSKLRTNLLKIIEKNSETFGWIRINGTEINYPIMKGTDNSFYLTHSSDKSEAKAGAIFCDYRVDNDYLTNKNFVMYGHCMSNGTMFGSIRNFYQSSSREAKAKTMKIEVITPDGAYIYQVFSTYRSEGAHFIMNNFSSTEEYTNFLSKIKGLSTLKETDVKYSENSRIITLSTCTNRSDKPNERYVLHCILKSFIPISDNNG